MWNPSYWYYITAIGLRILTSFIVLILLVYVHIIITYQPWLDLFIYVGISIATSNTQLNKWWSIFIIINVYCVFGVPIEKNQWNRIRYFRTGFDKIIKSEYDEIFLPPNNGNLKRFWSLAKTILKYIYIFFMCRMAFKMSYIGGEREQQVAILLQNLLPRYNINFFDTRGNQISNL